MVVKKRRAKKSEEISPETLLASAIDLAAEAPWAEVTVWDIAHNAGGTSADFYRFFLDKSSVLLAYSEKLDEAVAAAFPDIDETSPVKERVFDVLMERLEASNRNRAASLSFLRSLSCDPKQALAGGPQLAESMRNMLDVAKVETSGLLGLAKVAGLTLGYVWVLRTWAEDESSDLGKTMAALDQMLSRCHWANERS